MSDTCDQSCPVKIGLEIADRVIDDVEAIHESPEANRGVNALHRKCAERVREAYPCGGPVSDDRSLVTCPLSALISDVVHQSVMLPMAQQFAVPPDKAVSRSIGQYL